MSKSFLLRSSYIAVLILLFVNVSVGTLQAASAIVVRPSNLQGWLIFSDGAPGLPANANFQTGPLTPPLGIGSYGATITTGTRVVLGRTDAAYNGVPLSSLTEFSYSTFLDPTSTISSPPFANVYLDTTGSATSYNYRLDFAPNGATNGIWQTWDGMTQAYWLVFKRGTGYLSPTPTTLAGAIAAVPAGARVINGFVNYPSIKFSLGDSANSFTGLVASIDNITIGFSNAPTTWDFEPDLPPTPTSTVQPTQTAQPSQTVYPTVVFQPTKPAQPTVPLCQDLQGSTNSIIRADTNGAVTGGNAYCRVLAQNGVYVIGSQEIGVQSVIDAGVINAVDIFGLLYDGHPAQTFNRSVQACLLGTGRLVYLDATQAPRRPVTLQSINQAGYSCVSIPNPGTLVLVMR